MNHYVPDFEMVDEVYALPSSSSRPKKSSMMEEDIRELLWQNGQVVTQSQNSQRSVLKKTPHQPMLPASSQPSKFDQDAAIPANHPQSTARNIPQQQQLFMQEDEMASWLHYPLNDANFDDHDDICAALLYPAHTLSPPSSAAAASSSTTTVAAVACAFRPLLPPAAMRPPVPPPRRTEAVANFPLFSRQRGGRVGEVPPEAGPSGGGNRSFPTAVVRESTVVDSSVTPAVCCEATAARSATMSGGANSNTTTNRETAATCDASVTSSPGGSSASAEPPPPPPSAPLQHSPVAGGCQKPPPDHDRKRKGVDEDLDYHSEDTEFESANPKKKPQPRGSTPTKRSRAAEVHNLSERRRRDRINEKMRALQELIPRCNKSDKASMLDEAIEYLKSLQLQVQLMSMGCGMVPMMFPGVQQYMSPIGMGLGVGMGMEMGMNRPMMPFPNVLAGASLSTPAAVAQLGPRFPVPAFHMPPVPTDPSRMQGAGPRDPMLNSTGVSNSNQVRGPNFADPYQQYLSLQQIQLPVFQNQATVHPNSSGKPSSSQGTDNLDNNQSGL